MSKIYKCEVCGKEVINQLKDIDEYIENGGIGAFVCKECYITKFRDSLWGGQDWGKINENKI